MDTSGSMDLIRDEVIGMYNSQVETLRKSKDGMGDIFCTLVYFGLSGSERIQTVYEGVALENLEQMTRYDYLPQDMTPMRDGIGRALTIGQSLELGEQDAVLLIVLTDGMENASREWTPEQLVTKIRELRSTDKWTIQVMGANIDFEDIKDFGIEEHEFSRYTSSGFSVNQKSHAVSGYLRNYAVARGQGLNNTVGYTIEDVD